MRDLSFNNSVLMLRSRARPIGLTEVTIDVLFYSLGIGDNLNEDGINTLLVKCSVPFRRHLHDEMINELHVCNRPILCLKVLVTIELMMAGSGSLLILQFAPPA